MGWTLAIHLSESPEEVEFVRDGTGGLADIFGSNEWGGVGTSPVRYAQDMELLAPETIAAHLATGVSEEDLEILARTGVAAAHCPRSNDFLGCGVSPVRRMIERGIRVGMGTDGLWSSPSMNLFEETLFAVELHGMTGRRAWSWRRWAGRGRSASRPRRGRSKPGSGPTSPWSRSPPGGGDPERGRSGGRGRRGGRGHGRRGRRDIQSSRCLKTSEGNPP